MKTIFVTLPIGLSVRNILYTGVLDRLTAHDDVRVVAFTNVPDIEARYGNSNPRLIFEPLPEQSRHTLARLLSRMLAIRFYHINENPSLRDKRRTLRRVKPGAYLFDALLSLPLPRSRTLYRWLSALESSCGSISESVRSLFARYAPSLVLATNPTRMFEYEFLKHARRSGIPAVGMIHSWDVLTTKGKLVAPLDRYLVWNRVMKADLLQLYNLSEEHVCITGIPQFDIYAEPVSRSERERFFHEQGLDPSKKTVLFSTSPDWITSEEPEILDRLAAALEVSPHGTVQILVRLHPQDDVGRYASIRHPNVAFQVPGVPMAKLEDQRLMELADLELLRDTIAYCDTAINTASTMTIDAAAMDKPVVNIAFDLRPRDYYKSCRRFYGFVHYQPIVKSGAVKLATSFEELVILLHRYLDNPGLEHEERAQLRDMMCHKVDGKSAERIANLLLQEMEVATPPGVSATPG